jgi:flotillin
VKTQVEAIKNIKIDKITVWDGQNTANTNGKTATANFLSGLMQSVPPLNDLFNMAGMQLPKYLGDVKLEEGGKAESRKQQAEGKKEKGLDD